MEYDNGISSRPSRNLRSSEVTWGGQFQSLQPPVRRNLSVVGGEVEDDDDENDNCHDHNHNHHHEQNSNNSPRGHDDGIKETFTVTSHSPRRLRNIRASRIPPSLMIQSQQQPDISEGTATELQLSGTEGPKSDYRNDDDDIVSSTSRTRSAVAGKEPHIVPKRVQNLSQEQMPPRLVLKQPDASPGERLWKESKLLNTNVETSSSNDDDVVADEESLSTIQKLSTCREMPPSLVIQQQALPLEPILSDRKMEDPMTSQDEDFNKVSSNNHLTNKGTSPSNKISKSSSSSPTNSPPGSHNIAAASSPSNNNNTNNTPPQKSTGREIARRNDDSTGKGRIRPSSAYPKQDGKGGGGNTTFRQQIPRNERETNTSSSSSSSPTNSPPRNERNVTNTKRGVASTKRSSNDHNHSSPVVTIKDPKLNRDISGPALMDMSSRNVSPSRHKTNSKQQQQQQQEEEETTSKSLPNHEDETQSDQLHPDLSIDKDLGATKHEPNQNRVNVGIRREQRRHQKQKDQGNDTAVVSRTKMTNYPPTSNAARVDNRSIREQPKDANIGDEGAMDISPNRLKPSRDRKRTKKATQGKPNSIFAESYTANNSICPSEFSGTQNGWQPGVSNHGTTFRAQRHVTDEGPSEEYSYSSKSDEQLMPGAFKVNTEGIERRTKFQSPEEFSGSISYASSAGRSLSISFKSGKSDNSSKPSTTRDRGALPVVPDAEISADEEKAVAPMVSAARLNATEDGTLSVEACEKDAFSIKTIRRKPCLLIVVSLVVVAIVTVGIAVPLAIRDKETTSPQPQQFLTPHPSAAPTDAPTTVPVLSDRAKAFIKILGSVSAESDLLDTSLSQGKAVTWLADSDDAKLDPFAPDMDTRILVERYIMALLYVALNPQFSFNGFMTAGSVCGWNDSRDSGVFCEEGYITEIRLGKLFVRGSLVSTVLLFGPSHPLSPLTLLFNR